MKIPFTTSEEMKRAMSGLDLSLDLDNIQSSLSRVPNDLIEVIGLPVYNEMISHYTTPKTENAAVWDTLVELCQKAMLPLALYKHFIWLQIRVSNNAITTYKGDSETTAYKYQTDEAKESLLDSWGDFVSLLVEHLNANKDVITQWPLTEQYAAQKNSVFTCYREFCRLVNIRPADAAFYIRVSDLVQDVTDDELSTIIEVSNLEKTDSKFRKAQKFVAYRAMSLATTQFDPTALPAPVRRSIINEMNGKSGQEFDFAKQKLAAFFKQEAAAWLEKLSQDILADDESASDSDVKTITTTTFSSTDKGVGLC